MFELFRKPRQKSLIIGFGNKFVNDISYQLLSDLSVVSDADTPELRSIYRAAAEGLDLQIIDYQTIRDMVKITGASDVWIHLLLISLFMALREGSVCLRLSPESLRKKLKPIAGDKTDAYIRSILGDLHDFSDLIYKVESTAPSLFNSAHDAFKPLICVEARDERFLYFQKYHAAEESLKRALSTILTREQHFPQAADELASILRTVLHEKPVIVNGAPAILNSEQKLGILLPVLNNFVLISGGPGTGKTFIVLTLLRVIVRLGIAADRIRIAAPTGRAAQKLTDSIHQGIASIQDRDARDDSLSSVQGATIHRLLQYSPSRNDFLNNRYNRIRADLIIVDEASMIDITLLGKLIEALDDHATIVMLGDRNQLPSVEAGAVLADLISDDRRPCFSVTAAAKIKEILPDIEDAALPAVPRETGSPPGGGNPLADRVVLLHQNFRFDASFNTIAGKINARDQSVLDDIPELDIRREFPERGIWRIEPGTSGEPYYRELHRILDAWAGLHYSVNSADEKSFASLISRAPDRFPAGDRDGSDRLKKIFVHLDAARILTPIRSGISGTAGINGFLQERLGGSLDPAGRSGIFSGAPIVIAKNDYERSLFNGDVGVILRGSGGQYRGVFSRFGGFASFPVETLPPYELAFAITVHKSQGSEYGRVLLILPEGITESLLTTEIVYTGLTRAKNLVIMYAKRSILSRAIENRTERESGIRFL